VRFDSSHLLATAAVWWNLLPDGSPDPLTLHAGCPVVEGTKFGMNLWFRERSRRTPSKP
jgi:prolyl 4-hydroxylase